MSYTMREITSCKTLTSVYSSPFWMGKIFFRPSRVVKCTNYSVKRSPEWNKQLAGLAYYLVCFPKLQYMGKTPTREGNRPRPGAWDVWGSLLGRAGLGYDRPEGNDPNMLYIVSIIIPLQGIGSKQLYISNICKETYDTNIGHHQTDKNLTSNAITIF